MKSKLSLAETHPEVAKQWHPTKNRDLTSYDFTSGSNKKAWWKCEKGGDHEWMSVIYNRSKGNGCIHCANINRKISFAKSILEKRGSLLNNFPDIAKEWHPTKNGKLTPMDVTSGSGQKVWWQCKNSHEWKAVIHNRKKGVGCPECAGQKVGKDNNLSVVFPEISTEWHPTKNGTLTPRDFTSGSRQKVWWQCKNKHEWKTTIASRTGKNKTGCPKCKPQISLIQIRIYCELKTIFNQVELGVKIANYECDIYLPDHKVAIEYVEGKEKLETFETQKDNPWMATNMPDGPPGSAVFGPNIGFRIPRQEIYRVGEVFYGFRSCEMLNAKDFRLAMMSPLTSPSASAPIATMSSLAGNAKSSGLSSNYLSVAISGYKYNFTPSTSAPTPFITPSSSPNAMSISYTRRPVDVQWSYVVINDKPLYNDNVSIDFELHSSEETELVYKILKLAGVGLKAQEIVQVGQALEQTQIQQEKK